MEESDYVRTRLTHSYEVSNLARSIGVQLAFEHASAVFGADHARLEVDSQRAGAFGGRRLGARSRQPAFWTQGEQAIQEWFKEKKDETIESDFFRIRRNAQTFRLLTRLQILSDQYGLNLTRGTLAALIKYPACMAQATKRAEKSTEFSAANDTSLRCVGGKPV